MDIQALIQANPRLWIVIFAFFVSVVITIANYFLTDKELMKNIKEKQKRLREEMKKYRNDSQKMMELNKQMMEDFPNQMKQSMKVSVITLIPLLLLFNWLRVSFASTTLAEPGLFGWPIWTWWYILSSLVWSMILRKLFKLD